MKTQLMQFSATDGVILDGIINKCERKTNNVLIQIHGMTSNCFKNKSSDIFNIVRAFLYNIKSDLS